MQPGVYKRSLAWLLCVVVSFLNIIPASSDDRISSVLFVKDSLTVPKQSASIEGRLVSEGMGRDNGLGGEPIELIVGNKVAATGMTGGDGRVFLSYTPTVQGIVPITLRVGDSPRVAKSQGHANLVVWERRNPIIVVDIAALMADPPSGGPLGGLVRAKLSERKPLPDAADELEKLTRFYYKALYILSAMSGADSFRLSDEAREWLKANNFPPGYVVILSHGDDMLGAKLDEWSEAGWTTIKTGIVRSKEFAESFIRRRLDAVIVPEPTKGEAPRRAKVAKEWKEVRKKL